MAYRANWLTHMLATVTGRGFDQDLVRDFWRSTEDLWDPQGYIPLRWLKLVAAYTVSAFAQISAPLALVGIIIVLLKHGNWRWYTFAIALGTVGGVVAAVLAATGAYLRLLQTSKLERKKFAKIGEAIPKFVGALALIAITAFYAHLLLFGAPR